MMIIETKRITSLSPSKSNFRNDNSVYLRMSSSLWQITYYVLKFQLRRTNSTHLMVKFGIKSKESKEKKSFGWRDRSTIVCPTTLSLTFRFPANLGSCTTTPPTSGNLETIDLLNILDLCNTYNELGHHPTILPRATAKACNIKDTSLSVQSEPHKAKKSMLNNYPMNKRPGQVFTNMSQPKKYI